ncbi:putative reverse transcriptase domain, reverse transcriptase zinc-binding domain protein [Tanacetum coccineum]
MLTQELMHNYHLDRGTPRCAFKVDIQKAYDTVDWEFLRTILHGFGFHDKMVSWIMECVSTTSYSICVNGSLHGYFKGKRGLRQGDPLSPYLFTLVMELVNLCFADDLFLFAYGDVNSASIIKELLDEFKVASRVTKLPRVGFRLKTESFRFKYLITNPLGVSELGPLLDLRLGTVNDLVDHIGTKRNEHASFGMIRGISYDPHATSYPSLLVDIHRAWSPSISSLKVSDVIFHRLASELGTGLFTLCDSIPDSHEASIFFRIQLKAYFIIWQYAEKRLFKKRQVQETWSKDWLGFGSFPEAVLSSKFKETLVFNDPSKVGTSTTMDTSSDGFTKVTRKKNKVDIGDECGVSSSTASEHTTSTWNKDFESDDEVDEDIFPEGNKWDDQFDIRLKGRVRK